MVDERFLAPKVSRIFSHLTFKDWVLGSKSKVPARVRATVISGLVTKPWVAGLASFLPVKFLL